MFIKVDLVFLLGVFALDLDAVIVAIKICHSEMG